jgi:hypothetical protein
MMISAVGKVYVKYTMTNIIICSLRVSVYTLHWTLNVSQQSNNIKLITGQRGNLLVLFNNYKYNQNIKYTSGEIKWRCDII